MATQDNEILQELRNISFVLGDLNAIRNGEYDPPTGSGSTGSETGSQATPNDLARLIEESNELLGEIVDELRQLRQKT